jgi:hypothetical protein
LNIDSAINAVMRLIVMLHVPNNTFKQLLLGALTLGFGTLGIAQLGLAQSPVILNPPSLEIYSGTAKDLGNIPEKSSILWLSGVGGDVDNEEVEEFPYEIRHTDSVILQLDRYSTPNDENASSKKSLGDDVTIPFTHF